MTQIARTVRMALHCAVLAVVVGVAFDLPPARAQTASAPPATAGPVDPALIEDLVAANRVLADQGVLDGFGHVSMRHPADPNRFLMSRQLAPALVKADDIMSRKIGFGHVR